MRKVLLSFISFVTFLVKEKADDLREKISILKETMRKEEIDTKVKFYV
jgi:hypothetical protein